MPRLVILCLHRRSRLSPLAPRLAHSGPGRNRQPLSEMDVAVGLVVFFMTFLTPCGYILHNLSQFRRQ
ncbi:unnamed protein product [Pipistrellus nathusii]|uniref:Cytochrome c oxidase subunit 8 n=2 Tax=Pipistrellus TaxID=27671 RepID=A0A7J7SFP4_PIPKU|nr:cytochrome c oxidase subunit 8C, mitochondrial [Pipistrellus kuhlii]KAF6287211.1 cytochrome c oxidase subunit 8C [Pipistrellus kuhlii]